MARSYRTVDRDQPFLLPPSMTDWLPEDHSVWFFIEAVNHLDTGKFHEQARLGGVGRRGYDPEMLLVLLMYAMAQGISSSRKIERLCHTDVAFRVICAQDVPDHTVLARFRQVHEEALADLLTQTLELAAQLGMVKLGVVALDGTKISGNAALDRNRGEDGLRKLAEQYLVDIEDDDRAEDELFGHDSRGDELPEDLHDRTGRKKRIKEALEQVKARKEADSKAETENQERAQKRLEGISKGRGGPGKYPAGIDRVEAARSAWQVMRDKHQTKFDEWTAKKNRGQRPPGKNMLPPDEYAMVRQAWDRYQNELKATQNAPAPTEDTGARRGAVANLTDPESRLMTTRNGWIQGYNCQTAATEDGFLLVARATNDPTDMLHFIPTMNEVVGLQQRLHTATRREDLKQVGTLLADTGYDSKDNLAEPGPDRLIAQGKRRDVERDARKSPADGPPDKELPLRDQMSHRLRSAEGVATYRRRGHLVEAPNAWLKDGRGLRRFARRGLTAAQAELSLAAAITNLLKIRALGITTAQLQAT